LEKTQSFIRTIALHDQREKQLQIVLLNTTGMYGDLQGLIGPSMQSIPALEAGDPGAENIV